MLRGHSTEDRPLSRRVGTLLRLNPHAQNPKDRSYAFRDLDGDLQCAC